MTILRPESKETKKMKKLPIGIRNPREVGHPVLGHYKNDDKDVDSVEGRNMS